MIPEGLMVTEGKPKDRLGGRGRSVVSVVYPGAFHGNTPGMAD